MNRGGALALSDISSRSNLQVEQLLLPLPTAAFSIVRNSLRQSRARPRPSCKPGDAASQWRLDFFGLDMEFAEPANGAYAGKKQFTETLLPPSPSHPDNLIRLLPRSQYWRLNHPLSNAICKLPIRGRTKGDLLALLCRLDRHGMGLVGDVIRMTPQQIQDHAATVQKIQNPARLAIHLERTLERLDLGLCMAAPGWHRRPSLALHEEIAARDARLTLMRKASRTFSVVPKSD